MNGFKFLCILYTRTIASKRGDFNSKIWNGKVSIFAMKIEKFSDCKGKFISRESKSVGNSLRLLLWLPGLAKRHIFQWSNAFSTKNLRLLGYKPEGYFGHAKHSENSPLKLWLWAWCPITSRKISYHERRLIWKGRNFTTFWEMENKLELLFHLHRKNIFHLANETVCVSYFARHLHFGNVSFNCPLRHWRGLKKWALIYFKWWFQEAEILFFFWIFIPPKTERQQ